jgi:hypothetical protein
VLANHLILLKMFLLYVSCWSGERCADPKIEISKASPSLEGDFDLSHSKRYSVSHSIPSTTMSKRSHGVLDWNQPSAGQASWERTLWYVIQVSVMYNVADDEGKS